MFVACPSCETPYELPDAHASADWSVIRCAACGHGWLEAKGVEPTETITGPAADADLDLEEEAERIVAAAREDRARRAEGRNRRRRELRAWMVLGAAVLTPFLIAAAFPEQVVLAAPKAARLYAAAGIAVNVRGLEIRSPSAQTMTMADQRVLAVRGEIVNVSNVPRKVPSMRFSLKDWAAGEIYAWTLAGVGNRPLEPGERTTFLTRIASPPDASAEVEIRFARPDEINVNAAYDGGRDQRASDRNPL